MAETTAQKGTTIMIGIFDSGLGGLSALKEVRRLLPSEDIVYFGDTGRVPYGSRSKETIVKYALQDMNFLLSHKVDAVMVACGTASSNALDVLVKNHPDIPIVGVIDAGARAAAKITKTGTVAISGTASTIASGSFESALSRIDEGIKSIPIPCPLFVPLVENGFIEKGNKITEMTVEHYLGGLRGTDADTLILGCTHYPIIAPIISEVLPDLKLINVGEAAAVELKDIISDRYGSAQESGVGSVSFYVSDEPYGFEATASIFLGEEIGGSVKRIDIEKY